MRTRQAGYSLVELMVVMAIVAIVGAVAAVAMRKDMTPSAAREVAALMADARRLAVAHGAVRDNVTQATGITAAARLDFTFNGGSMTTPSSTGRVDLYELVEDPGGGPTATWTLQQTLFVNKDSALWATSTSAQANTGFNPPMMSGTATKLYYPNGSSDGYTVYIQSKSNPREKFRIFVMPLSGSATTNRGW